MFVAVVGTMRWGVPRAVIAPAEGEEFLLLSGRQFAPEVARRGHLAFVSGMVEVIFFKAQGVCKILLNRARRLEGAQVWSSAFRRRACGCLLDAKVGQLLLHD